MLSFYQWIIQKGFHVLHQNNILHLEVSNDGSAFEDNLLEQLLDGSKNAHGFGIGLVNIHQRIQMLFGTQYGLSFINRSNRAVAIVSIPYTTEGDCLC